MKDYTKIASRYGKTNAILINKKPSFIKTLFTETVFLFGLIWESISSLFLVLALFGFKEFKGNEIYLILGFVSIFHVIGILIIVSSIRSATKYIHLIAHGTDGEGTVTKRMNHSISKGKKTYAPFAIKYNVNGKDYNFNTRNIDLDRVEDIVVGSTVKIKYDPKEPKRAVWIIE